MFFLFTLGNDYHHDHVQHDRYRYRHNFFNHDQIHAPVLSFITRVSHILRHYPGGFAETYADMNSQCVPIAIVKVVPITR